MIVLNKIQVAAIESATQSFKDAIRGVEYEIVTGKVQSFQQLEQILSEQKSKLAVLEDLIEQFKNENGD